MTKSGAGDNHCLVVPNVHYDIPGSHYEGLGIDNLSDSDMLMRLRCCKLGSRLTGSSRSLRSLQATRNSELVASKLTPEPGRGMVLGMADWAMGSTQYVGMTLV